MTDRRVEDVMSRHLQTLEVSDDLDLAEMIMRLEQIRHLPVLEDGRLAGLVSHRDVLRAQAPRLPNANPVERRSFSLKVKVKDVMSRSVVTVHPRGSLLEAARLMHEHRFGALPVVLEGELIGVVTETDLLALLIERLEEESNATSG